MLSDQVTIIGVSNSNRTKIVKENICDQSAPVVTYSANIGSVYTLAVGEPNDVLFAGSCNCGKGQIMQYSLSNGQVLKNYSQVGIDSILSSTRIANMYVFGGYGSSKFVVIDSAKRQIVHKPVTTRIKIIGSMTVCKTKQNKPDSKTLLLISGNFSDNSNDRTDVFDMTGLVDKCAISPSDCSGKFTARNKHTKHA